MSSVSPYKIPRLCNLTGLLVDKDSFFLQVCWCLIFHCGPGSSIGIATDYGLDSLGSNPGEEEIFRPSRPALGPIQPPVQWVPGLSRR